MIVEKNYVVKPRSIASELPAMAFSINLCVNQGRIYFPDTGICGRNLVKETLEHESLIGAIVFRRFYFRYILTVIEPRRIIQKSHLEFFQNENVVINMSLPNVFKALSDPIRRDILILLKKRGEMSAGEIAAEFDISNATISYHLSLLRKADLVFEKRQQKYIYYKLNVSVFEDIVLWCMQFNEGAVNDDEKR